MRANRRRDTGQNSSCGQRSIAQGLATASTFRSDRRPEGRSDQTLSSRVSDSRFFWTAATDMAAHSTEPHRARTAPTGTRRLRLTRHATGGTRRLSKAPGGQCFASGNTRTSAWPPETCSMSSLLACRARGRPGLRKGHAMERDPPSPRKPKRAVMPRSSKCVTRGRRPTTTGAHRRIDSGCARSAADPGRQHRDAVGGRRRRRRL